MSKTTLMGKLLGKVQSARWEAKREAVVDLWARNGLENPTKRQGYTVQEIKTVSKDGAEVTTYRLWKLVDQSTVTIESKVTSKVQTGITKGDADELRGAEENNSTESPL